MKRNQIQGIFWKLSQWNLLMDWMWQVRERQSSRMAPRFWPELQEVQNAVPGGGTRNKKVSILFGLIKSLKKF